MKLLRATLMSAAILAGALAGTSALAFHGGGHFHGHARFGVFIGAPLFWGPWPYYYYPPPAYYPYPPVASYPPTYIEQGGGQAPAEQPSYWYYCAGSNAYYPYVKDCPGGWLQVAPQPPS